MEYIIATVVFFVLMLVYFRIADRFNIIDKPNHRSAHSEITLRGGGIVFPLSFLFFLGYEFIFNGYNFSLEEMTEPNYWIFGAGLLIICVISFVDDVVDLSTKIRLIGHFIAVSLLLYFLHAFDLLPFWAIVLCYIFVIGILNAYNFMDGINGMSGLYSVIVLGSLWFVNDKILAFVSADFIIFPLIAALVFLYFNFRKKAKCFLGDIGSMGIAFWIIALLGLLIVESGSFRWILFLSVYGVETILTIIERLGLRENIFAAHRRHLYQLFANERGVSHLYISSVYAAIQLIINMVVIYLVATDAMHFLIILIPAVIFYIFLKLKLKSGTSKKSKIDAEN